MYKRQKEGYEQLAAIFEETAANEKEHAKMWFKALNGGSIKVSGTDIRSVTRASLRGSYGTVSYTHLDVYKRQLLGCFVVQAVGHSGSRRLVDDAQHVQALSLIHI